MVPANLTEIGTLLSQRGIRSLPMRRGSALYIHVPFCRHKCGYCDFYSLAGMGRGCMEDYVSATLREAQWRGEHAGAMGASFASVFLGGGTPTALPISLMQRLLVGLRSALPIYADAEWTTEANPATLDYDYCAMLRDCGVNRLSVGAQSMVDSELKTLGRIHDARQVMQTVRQAYDAGFGRVSLDLIYAVPGQTLETWQYSLETALAMGIRHISCYCLTIEEQTPLWQQVRRGEICAVGEHEQREFMRFTRAWLRERGIPPYEISNYAAEGEECRHNLVYWRSGDYVGMGPAAASHLGGVRWRNVPDIGRYIQGVLNDGEVPMVEAEMLTASQRAAELIMLMIRTREGLNWARLAEVSGAQPWKEIMGGTLSRLGSLGLISTGSQGVKLTEQGVMVADGVISELVRELS